MTFTSQSHYRLIATANLSQHGCNHRSTLPKAIHRLPHSPIQNRQGPLRLLRPLRRPDAQQPKRSQERLRQVPFRMRIFRTMPRRGSSNNCQWERQERRRESVARRVMAIRLSSPRPLRPFRPTSTQGRFVTAHQKRGGGHNHRSAFRCQQTKQWQ